MKKKGTLILAFLLLIVGGGIFAYSSISDAVHQIQSTSSIKGHQKQVKETDETAMNAMIVEAEAFNKTLSDTLSIDPFQTGTVEPYPDDMEYSSLLNVNDLMDYIDIPVIGAYLSAYHGTSAATLKKGAGHLYGSALPAGGEGTRSVISVHQGLPLAKMFTDLDQVQMRDMFHSHVLNRILTYQVDKIGVVEPTEFSSLDPVPGEEYMALFTRTPYGINSHRLSVRGVRIPYEVVTAKEVAKGADKNAPKLNTAVPSATMMTVVGAGIVVLAAFVVLALSAVIVVTRTWRRYRRKRKGGWK